MGIGSKLKKAIRKVIPNELSEIAVKAAPIVAPFNPAIAAAMAGIGSFDQTGRIGDSLKSGIGTYALGQGARYLGGAGFQKPGMSAFTPSGFKAGFSSPLGTETGIGKLLSKDAGTSAAATETSSSIPSSTEVATGATESSYTYPSTAGDVAAGITPETDVFVNTAQNTLNKTLAENPTFADQVIKFLNMNEEGKAAQLIQMALSEKGMMIGRGLAAYLATKAGNEDQPQFRSWEEIPTNMYNLEYKNAKDGGIIGLANGGQPTMEMDYRGGGFIPVGAQERADDVPARLSKNEFVMTADAVRAAGGGSVDVGAQRMYNLMNQLEGVA